MLARAIEKSDKVLRDKIEGHRKQVQLLYDKLDKLTKLRGIRAVSSVNRILTVEGQMAAHKKEIRRLEELRKEVARKNKLHLSAWQQFFEKQA